LTARVPDKWRPTLGMIVFAVLATVLALPLVGLFFFRLYENQLIRQTESELIAQSAALAAIFAREGAATPGLLLGPVIPPDPRPRYDEGPYRPIEATLDLTDDALRGRRPDAVAPSAPPAPAAMTLGMRLEPLATETQRVTLAGFRLLDAAGTVIAGREEVGLSLAHVEEVAEALKGRYVSVLRTRVSDEPPPPLYSISRGTGVRVFTAMPVAVDGRVAGVIYASRTPNNIIKHIYSERGKFILAALATMAVTLGIGVIFSRVITRPIHALVERATAIGQGDRAAMTPLAHHGTREIALLSQSFLDMAGKLEDRSDYIATFAAHVSHELKTPLTSIQGAAELLRDDAGAMTADQRDRFLDNIIADTNRLTAMLHRLRELARADNPEIAGSTTMGEVAEALRPAFPSLGITLGGDDELVFGMSRENALIVFSHLADNAACHGARSLRVEITSMGGHARVTVEDDGEGISPGNREKIFDAFFTTRRDSGGTGMGLGIVEAMLRAHGGSIRLMDKEGAAFEIRMPLG
jgi:signal transduction histidine kinase